MLKPIYLLESLPYDPVSAGTKVVNFSSGLTEETLSGATAPYPVRLSVAYTHETSVFESNIPGQTNVSIGSSTINNADGRFDFLLDYNWDNRVVTIKKGFQGDAYGAFTTEFVGRTVEINSDGNNLIIVLKDNSLKLAKPLQNLKYAGTGSAEGGLDLKGKTKPLLFGTAYNMTPVIVEAVKLTFQIHSGVLTAVYSVYDRGNLIRATSDYASYALLVAATVPPGSYATCLTLGFIRLGAPPVGTLTVDAKGYETSASIGTQLKDILINFGGLVSGDLDTASFTALNTTFPYATSGMYFSEPDLQVDEFLETAASTVNGYWYVTASGLVTVGIFAFTSPSFTIRAEDILGLGRVSSPSPLYQVSVNYSKNSTVQSLNDFTIPRQTFNGQLTKGYQFITTAADGTGGVYTTDAIFKVYLNDYEINKLNIVNFAVLSGNAWLSIDSSGVLSITDPGAATATGTLRANLGEFNVDLNFTVARSLGALKTITLTSNRTHILIDDSGALKGAQDVVMTVAASGTTLTTLTAVDNLGNNYAITNNGDGTWTFPASSVVNSPLAFFITWTASDAAGIKQTRRTNIRRGIDGYAEGILSAYSAGDSAITLFYQISAPASNVSSINDLWFDTDDSNKIYRYDGSTWIIAADTRIPQALSAASASQTTADSKIKTFFGETTPTATTVGDLWYKASTRTLSRWDGSVWTNPVGTVGAISGPSGNLQDSGGQYLTDGAIKNVAITLSSSGVLSGAGGGSITAIDYTAQIVNRPILATSAVTEDEFTADLTRWYQLVTNNAWSAIATPAPRFSKTSFQSTAGQQCMLRGQDVPIDRSATYMIEVWMDKRSAANGGNFLGNHFKDVAGAIIDNFSGFYHTVGSYASTPAAGDPQRMAFLFGAGTENLIPAGAVTMAPQVFINIGVTAGAYVSIEGLRITKLASVPLWKSTTNQDVNNQGFNYAITSDSITKLGSVDGWDAAAVTRAGYSNLRVSGVPVATGYDQMIGLTTSSAVNNFGSGYNIYYAGGNGITVYELGTNVLTVGTYATPPKMDVEYDGNSIRYYVNDVLVRTTAISAGLTMFGAIFGYNRRSGFTAVNVGGALFKDFGFISGATKPENSATSGANLIFNGNAESGSVGFGIADTTSTGATLSSASGFASNGALGFALTKANIVTAGGSAVARAIPVVPGRRYAIRITVSGDTAQSGGLYLRINEKTSAPSDGVYISTDRTSLNDLILQGNVTTIPTTYEFLYTAPAGVIFVSPSILNWVNGPLVLKFDDFAMKEIIEWSTGIAGAPSTAIRYWDMNYPTLTDFKRDFTSVGSQLPDIVTTNDGGGKATGFGDNTGDDYTILQSKEFVSFEPSILYEIAYDVEIVSGAGLLYLGVECQNNLGQVLNSDTGGYHYVAASGLNIASNIGRSVMKGYFKGAANLGLNPIQVGTYNSTPILPTKLTTDTVKFRPLGLINYPNSAGRVIIHGIKITKYAGALAVQDTATWGSQVVGTGKPANYASVSDNLVLNSDFSDILNNWLVTANPVPFTRVAGGAGDPGLWKARSTGLTGIGQIQANGGQIPVVGGARVWISGWIRSSGIPASNDYGYLSMNFFNSSGALGVSGVGTYYGNTSSWTYVSQFYVVPANATYAVVAITSNIISSTSVQIEFTGIRVAYTEPGATLGAISGTNLFDSTGASLTDSAIKNTAITLSSAGVISGAGGGSITALDFSNTVGATKPEAYSTLDGNLIPNGQFTTDTINWNFDAGTGLVRVSGSSGDPYPGFIRKGTTTAPNNLIPRSAQNIPIRSAQIFLEFWFRVNNLANCLVQGYFDFRDVNGTPLTSNRILYINNAYATSLNTWTKFSQGFTPPANAAYFMLVLNPNNSANASYTIDITNIYAGATQRGADITALNPKVLAADPFATGGDNLIANPLLLDGSNNWTGTTTSGISRVASTNSTDPAPYFFRITENYSNQLIARGQDMIPVIPGKKLFFYVKIRNNQNFTTSPLSQSLQFWGADKVTNTGYLNQAIYGSANNVWTFITYSGIVPAGSAFVQPYFTPYSYAAGTTFDIAAPLLTYTELNATVGAQSGINLLDSGGQSLTDSAIKNTAVTISAAGILSGAGGGSVTFTGLGGGAVGTQADIRLGGSYFKDSAGTALGDLDVRNARISSTNMVLIDFPKGASYNNTSGTVTGFLVVTLPSSGAANNTLLKFQIDVYDYSYTQGSTYYVAGQTGSNWALTSASYVGPDSAARTVVFGKDTAGNLCIYIGSASTVWGFPNVVVSNFRGGYVPGPLSGWESGWSIGITATGPTTTNATVTRPSPGQLRLGADILDSVGTVQLDQYLKNSAITISSAGVLSGAGGGSITALDFANTAGATKPENNATVGARAGTNLLDSGGASLTDSAIKNIAVTISAAGVLTGAGGGTVTYGGLGGGNVGLQTDLRLGGLYLKDSAGVTLGDATVKNSAITISGAGVLAGAGGGSITALDFINVAGATRPANNATVGAQAGINLLDSVGASLTDSIIKNTAVTITAAGVLTGAGGGTVTYGGLGGGNVGLQTDLRLGGLYLKDSVGTTLGDATVKNSAVSISSAGVLTGAGGGSVTALDFSNVAGATKPQNNADVTALAQIIVDFTTTNVNVSASSTGVLDSVQFPITLPFPQVTRGGTSIRGDNLATYAIVNVTVPGTTPITVDNTNGSATKGQVTISSAMTGSGSFSLTISYNGTLMATLPVTVRVINAAPPPPPAPSGTTSGSTPISGNVGATSTSPIQNGNIVTVVVAAGKTITCQMTDTYTTSGISRSCLAWGQWQYSPTGANTWTALGAYVSASPNATTDAEGTVMQIGSLTVNQTVAPMANTYDLRFMNYKSGSGLVVWDTPATGYVSVA